MLCASRGLRSIGTHWGEVVHRVEVVRDVRTKPGEDLNFGLDETRHVRPWRGREGVSPS